MHRAHGPRVSAAQEPPTLGFRLGSTELWETGQPRTPHRTFATQIWEVLSGFLTFFVFFFYFKLMFTGLRHHNFQLIPHLANLSFWPPGSQPVKASPRRWGPARRVGALTRSQSWASQWAGQFLSPQGWMARGLVSIWH